MSLIHRILELNRQAAQRLSQVKEAGQAAALQAGLRGQRYKIPLDSQGIAFNEEGIETHFAGAEVLDLGLSLPTTRAQWMLTPGTYRIAVTTQGSARLTAETRDGSTLFKDRRTTGYAVVDVGSGDVVLKSTQPMTAIRVMRYTRRAHGEIILGPFQGTDGVVSVNPVGHGNWTAEVAYDSYIEGAYVNGLFEPVDSTLISDTFDGIAEYTGEGLHQITQPAGAERYSSVSRFLSPVPSLSWESELKVGVVPTRRLVDTQTFSHYTQFDAASMLLWAGVGEWEGFASLMSPSFTELPGWWTYVWGTCAVEDPALLLAAYDMLTGRPVTATVASTVPGMYLICVMAENTAARDQHTTISGSHGRFGMPVLRDDDPRHRLDPVTSAYHRLHTGAYTVTPGTYTRVPVETFNRHFLIRIRGEGTLKALEVTTRSTLAGPGGEAFAHTVREPLSSYFEASSIGLPFVKQNDGAGLFLPANA